MELAGLHGSYEVTEFLEDQSIWFIHMFLAKHFLKRKGASRDEVQRKRRELMFTLLLHAAHFPRHVTLDKLSPRYSVLYSLFCSWSVIDFTVFFFSQTTVLVKLKDVNNLKAYSE